jgi:thioredoxin-like negative regulator of GroEL
MQPEICSVSPDRFTEEVLLEEKPVLLVCLAVDDSFSGQLKVVRKTAEKYSGPLKMVLLTQDALEKLKTQLQISGTPTFLLMRKGREVNRILGVVDEEGLTRFLSEYISTI